MCCELRQQHNRRNLVHVLIHSSQSRNYVNTKTILKFLQHEVFNEEIKLLRCCEKGEKDGNDVNELSQGSDIDQRNKPVPFTVFTDLFATIACCPLVEGSSVPIFLPSIVRHYHDRVEHQGRGITINKLRFNNYGNIGCFKLHLEIRLLLSPWRCSNTANDSRPA